MAIHIDDSGTLVHDQAASFALVCPHCDVLSHLTAVSVPAWPILQATKPSHVGIVYRCDACNAPVFLKFPVKLYGNHRVELSPVFQELERPREKFEYAHLPESIELLCREALTVFASGCWNAFASMSRRIMQEVAHDLGEHGKLKLFDQLNDSREMAELDAETFNVLRRILLAGDTVGGARLPPLDAETAGVLLEVLKDLLYQSYVRRGRLQQAMMARRRYAQAQAPSNVTVFNRTKA